MRALIIPEGFHQHGQPGGCAVQLAQVCQAGLAPLQLTRQPLHIWQPCMPMCSILLRSSAGIDLTPPLRRDRSWASHN